MTRHMQNIVIKGYHYDQEVYDKYTENEIFYLALNFTSNCNYKCPYCFVGQHDLNTKADSDLTLEKIKALLVEARASGAKVLVVPGRGEPFLDKNFWSVVEYATSLEYWIVVYTNGSRLDVEKIQQIKQLPISLYLKVDSFDKAIYEKMVGVERYGYWRRLSACCGKGL